MRTGKLTKIFGGLVIAGIISVFGLAISGLFLNTCASLTGGHQREAESQARTWTSSVGMEVKAITCNGTDSDGDGYVSCTIVEATEGGSTIHNMECAGAYNLNQGCRLQKPVLRSGRSAD